MSFVMLISLALDHILSFYMVINLLSLNSMIKIVFSDDYFLKEDILESKVPIDFLSHDQRYEESLKKSIHLLKKIREFQSECSDVADVEIYM